MGLNSAVLPTRKKETRETKKHVNSNAQIPNLHRFSSKKRCQEWPNKTHSSLIAYISIFCADLNFMTFNPTGTSTSSGVLGDTSHFPWEKSQRNTSGSILCCEIHSQFVGNQHMGTTHFPKSVVDRDSQTGLWRSNPFQPRVVLTSFVIPYINYPTRCVSSVLDSQRSTRLRQATSLFESWQAWYKDSTPRSYQVRLSRG